MKFWEREHRLFNLPAAARVYETHAQMSEAAFWQLVRKTLEIRALGIPGLDWLLFDHVLSATTTTPLEVHFEALAAGHEMPFRGIEDLHLQLIEAKILPPWVLNRTHFHEVPSDRSDLGRFMVELGLLAEPTLRRASEIKTLVLDKTGVDPSLGQVLRSVGALSMVDFFQVMGLRLRIPFESLDQSAPTIYGMSSARNTGTFRTGEARPASSKRSLS